MSQECGPRSWKTERKHTQVNDQNVRLSSGARAGHAPPLSALARLGEAKRAARSHEDQQLAYKATKRQNFGCYS
jgi:hypothetical protein